MQQSSQGKISEELINRLMSILGHLIQLRTLKVFSFVTIGLIVNQKHKRDFRDQYNSLSIRVLIILDHPKMELHKLISPSSSPLLQTIFVQKKLREMVEMGLTAKQEKADRFQLIKREVMEMIELQVSNMLNCSFLI